MFRSSLSRRLPLSHSTSRAGGRLFRSVLGAGAGLLALSALPGTASALNLSTVYFREASPNGAVLDTWVLANENTYHFRHPDLADQLTSAPLGEVLVQYWSESTSAEVHTFLRDPSELSATARDVTDVMLVGDPYGDLWEPLTRVPSQSDLVSVPFDVVVPYPNMDTFSISGPPPPAEVPLALSKFIGPAPHTTTLVKPKVKGVRMYDHGQCSATAALLPIYDELQETAWCQAKQGASDAGINLKRWYTNAITQLDRPGESHLDRVEDGFLLNGHFTAIITDPISDVDVHIKAESVFTLDDGHVQVNRKGTDLVLRECTGSPVLCDAEAVAEKFEEALGTLRPAIAQKAERQQSVAMGSCNPQAQNPCADRKLAVQSLVGAGILYLEGVGYEFYDLQEREAMLNAVVDADLWTCDTAADVQAKIDAGDHCDLPTQEELDRLAAGPTCRMFLPASRLNVYPDELELVWFDGKEVDNPAYALWVGLQYPDAPNRKALLAQMCSQQENDYTQIDHYTREYASSSFGVDYLDWQNL